MLHLQHVYPLGREMTPSLNDQPIKKKTPAQGGRQLLRQVSYRQETYRAVVHLYALERGCPTEKFENVIATG